MEHLDELTQNSPTWCINDYKQLVGHFQFLNFEVEILFIDLQVETAC